MPPVRIEGLDAEKYKRDRSFNAYQNQIKKIGN
jgi:hypothetical protein